MILTGGIDLSVGSTVGLSGFMCGLTMASGLHPVFAVLVGLFTGAIIGVINGIIVAFVGVTPFIVTLGMLGIARGAGRRGNREAASDRFDGDLGR